MSGYVWQGNRQILFGPRKSIAESDPGTSVAIGVKLGNRSFLSLGNFICYTLGTPFDLTEPMSRKHRYFTGLLWAQRVGHFWKNCMKIILEPSCDAWWQGEKWRGCRTMDGHGTRTTFGFVRYCFCAYSTGVRTESGAGLLYHNIRKPPTKSTKKNAGNAGCCMHCLLWARDTWITKSLRWNKSSQSLLAQ